MRMSMVSDIPRKHAHSLQRLHSLALDFGTFAFAKDQASLSRDGLLKDYPDTMLSYIILDKWPAHRSQGKSQWVDFKASLILNFLLIY